MDDMQIAKLVMQIHANYVLIIDSKKNQIFLMGGAGVTHVKKICPGSIAPCSLLNMALAVT
jgi:hypothetical protein